MSAAQVMARPILVVDDDGDVREALSSVLESEGYDVVTAINGADALAHLRAATTTPCVILLDLMMPVMDGFRFRSEQTSDLALSAIPVILLTADGNAQQKAATLGTAGFLKKPVDLDVLLDAVKCHC